MGIALDIGTFETAEGAGASGETPAATFDMLRNEKLGVVGMELCWMDRGRLGPLATGGKGRSAAERVLEKDGRTDRVTTSIKRDGSSYAS